VLVSFMVRPFIDGRTTVKNKLKYH
jgi:hypothetical protein